MRKYTIIFTVFMIFTMVLVSCTQGGQNATGTSVNPLIDNYEGDTEDATATVTEVPGTIPGAIPETDAPSTGPVETYQIIPGRTRDDETAPVTEGASETSKPVARETLTYTAAMDKLEVKTVSGHSVVCYSTEKDADGGMQIIVAVNNAAKTSATLSTYSFYAELEDYSRVASAYTDENVLNRELHMIKTGESEAEIIENPDDFIYIALFGFMRY